jgi:3-oxoacyl-[acyl-carrier-protein] synthase-3
MMPKNARIVGSGSYLPRGLVSNRELEKRIKNFDSQRAGMPFSQWAEQVSGIKQRYYIDETETTELMAAEAAKKAMAAAEISAKEVDFIIASSFTPLRDIPNLACSLAQLIGKGDIGGFVLNTACAGFIYAMAMGYSLIRSGIYRTILIVSAESLSRVTDFNDPRTAILFADGAGAVILQATDTAGMRNPAYLSSYFDNHFDLINADILNNNLIAGDKGCVSKTYIRMPGGPKVLRKAIYYMAGALLRALELSPYKLQDLDWIIPHQANRRITEGLIQHLGVPPERFCATIDKIGNTSGASIPIALDKAVRGELGNGRIKRGDKVGLTAVGGGYSLGALVFEF